MTLDPDAWLAALNAATDRDVSGTAAKAIVRAYLASRPSAIIEEPMAVAVERPIMQPPRVSDEPEWAQVNALFRVHGLGDPPWRLRDELVGWLVWARYYRAALNAALTVEPEAPATDEMMDAAIVAYEVSYDGRYSAMALRKAVNAALAARIRSALAP